MEPEIKVIKKGEEYTVEFWVGNQGFELSYRGPKIEADWMARMLKKAFGNLTRLTK